MGAFFRWYMQRSLVALILMGLVAGVLLAILGSYSAFFQEVALKSSILGEFFIAVLKAVAPILVFILVLHAVSSHKSGEEVYIKSIIVLYVLGTFAASLVAVSVSFLWPSTLTLTAGDLARQAPSGISEVLNTLLFKIADNPFNALVSANYIGILTWAILLGFALRNSRESVHEVIHASARAVSQVVQWGIRLAPIGVFGLMASTLAMINATQGDTGHSGWHELARYGQLILVLLLAMLIVALVVNPLIVFFKLRKNPYPLVWRCLTESGVTAFFTRSSAANIPVNMELCKKLGLHEGTYSISIPLGATINMAGAAVTIAVLTLAATHTLGIEVDFLSALLLCVLATIGACGASGVPGGSLLLIPMACSLFNIPDDVSMQVVAVGLIIGVIQDSAETALNSSSDVLYTAAADLAQRVKKG